MIKNILKRQTTVVAITVICLCIGLIGISYAVFFAVNDSNEQTVTSGNLVIQFAEQVNNLTTATSTPLSDEEGTLSEGYTFSVKNIGSLPMKYNIYLYDDPDATKEAETDETKTMIPQEYIKVQLDKGAITTLDKLVEDGKVKDTEIPRRKVNTTPLSVLAKNSEGNADIKTHTIRIWIDEKAPETIIGNTIALQLEVFGEVGEVKPPKEFSEVIVADNINIFDDGNGNIRYAGADPSNYIWFNCDDYNFTTKEEAAEKNCERWRIIGLFKDIEKADGSQEDLVKIVRADSIGNYSWDNKNTSTGSESDYGKNDWTTAELMYLLNPDHESNNLNGVTANNSLYWNSGSGKCSNALNNATTNCDFSKTGLKGDDSGPTKSMIESVKWNLGGLGSTYTSTGSPKVFYEAERGATAYTGRPTTWTGKVGLIYPSDYGFATTGGTTGRNACLAKEMYNWYSGQWKTDCANNSWLKPSSNYLWTITPYAGNSNIVFSVRSDGIVNVYNANLPYSVRPSLYLNSKVKIAGEGGNGSAAQPYILTS